MLSVIPTVCTSAGMPEMEFVHVSETSPKLLAVDVAET
jgi:hypothetical protein